MENGPSERLRMPLGQEGPNVWTKNLSKGEKGDHFSHGTLLKAIFQSRSRISLKSYESIRSICRLTHFPDALCVWRGRPWAPVAVSGHLRLLRLELHRLRGVLDVLHLHLRLVLGAGVRHLHSD